MKLPLKIALLAAFNCVLLGAAFAAFLLLQVRGDLQSFLMAAGRERILAVSRQLALDLEETPAAERDRLLQRYADGNGVRMFLFSNDGPQVAGPAVELPPEVGEQLRMHGPGPGRRPPPDRMGFPDKGPDGKGLDDKGPPGPGQPQATFLVTADGPLRYWIGARIPIRSKEDRDIERGTLFLASSGLLTNPFFFQLAPWLWMLGGAALLSALCWLPLVRGLTRSIHRMRDATAQIAEGRFDVDPGVRRRDELGQLGSSIQRMASQLDTLVRGQKRFLADAAHELRSPLARMQLAAGILERKSEGDAAGYVDDIKEEIDTMARLTDELLAYARAESGAAQVRLDAVALTPILERAVRLEGEGADVRLEADPNLRVIAHPDYLLRAFSNVVRNSVRYAGDAGPVTVKAAANGRDVAIVFADSGPGVPADALDRIFTPFYRVEQSRNRRTGGTGLGLAIVRSSIEACKGSVECRNREPSGLEVIVRLPLA